MADSPSEIIDVEDLYPMVDRGEVSRSHLPKR